jgi:hypothetical protein
MHPSPLMIFVADHQGKARRLAEALARAGHLLVDKPPADLLLIDLDAPVFHYRRTIDFFKDQGATVLLYPHGAGQPLLYDGLYEPYERVDGSLVIGPGQAELMRRLEYPKPTYSIGWALCEQAPFRPARDVREVLFAPMHPNGDGTLRDSMQEANAQTFARLLEGDWHVTVRHIGTLEQNALWRADGVTYVEAGFTPATEQIDAADVVVAADGTFPSLSIARGTPTVMYAQAAPPGFGRNGDRPAKLRRPERYLDYIRYPFDVFDGPLDEVVHAAARTEQPILDWKRRFIGDQFDEAAFAAQVEQIVRRPERVAIEPTGSFTIAGFVDEVCERPELLAAYADTFAPGDDVTLVLWGPGFQEATLLDRVQRALAASSVDDERLPDVLLLPLAGSAAADRALAERAQAVLSEWPGAGRLGELPRFGAADGAALAAAAGVALVA